MFKNTILKQKQEKERFITFSYIERSKGQEAKKWLDSDLIKVIIGPRRSGKSIFSLMLLKDRPFAYFNFDNEAIQTGEDNFKYDELMQALHNVYGETKTILFDEIQNLPRWELFVNRLQREGYNLVLTGSNANLLSQELATALTGRHIPIEILPFDFKEFLAARQGADPQNILEQYLLSGGFPEVVVKGLDSKEYLAVLFDSLLFKDVVKRHKVRFAEQISNLGSSLINNVASQYSLRRLAKTLGFRSGVTLEKYLGYLIEAYIIFSVNRYSYKAGERLRSPKKAYVADNGFVGAKAVQHSPNTGKLFENLVFIELVKAGFVPNRELFYYLTRNNREIDFMLKKENTIIELIQVAHEAHNSDVEERETKALVEAAQELKVSQLTVITWDEKKELKKSGLTINFVPFRERFLSLPT